MFSSFLLLFRDTAKLMILAKTANIKATCASFMRPVEEKAFISTRYSMISKASCLVPPKHPMFAPAHLHAHRHTHMCTHAHTSRQYFVLKWQRTSFIHSKCLELCERETYAGNCHLLVLANKFSLLTKKARCKKSGILPSSHITDHHFTGITATHETKPPGTVEHFGHSCVTFLSTKHSSGKGAANLHIPGTRCVQVPRHVGANPPLPQLRRHSLPMPRPRYLRSRSFPGLCCLLVEDAALAPE